MRQITRLQDGLEDASQVYGGWVRASRFSDNTRRMLWNLAGKAILDLPEEEQWRLGNVELVQLTGEGFTNDPEHGPCLAYGWRTWVA